MDDRRLPGIWREDRHLSFFLAFLVLMTIFVPMVGESRPGRIAIDLTFALMLLSGAFATVNKRMLMYLIIALTILTTDLIAFFARAVLASGVMEAAAFFPPSLPFLRRNSSVRDDSALRTL